jgi:hypothetical protein
VPSSTPTTTPASLPTPKPVPAADVKKNAYTSAPITKRITYSGSPTALPPFVAPPPILNSACITVTIDTTVSEVEWIRDDVVFAMKQAVAKSFRVPVTNVFIDYNYDSCRASLEFNPSGAAVNRRTLSMESLFIPSFMNLALTTSSSSGEMSVYLYVHALMDT